MCKVMILKGIENSDLAFKFMKAVAPNMSVGNFHGIGYSAINSENKLFSEKWHDNSKFLDTETVIDDKTLKMLEPFKARLGKLSLNYQSTGTVTRDDLRTVTLHTRFATCGKEFENTHPFIDNEMSLIHNGGISNSHILGLNKVSTCDSENALQLYNNEQLNLATESDSFQRFIDQLKGYWAFAFLAKNAEGIYMLDVVRERASLHYAYLPEIGKDCVIFATTTEIIETGIKELGLNPAKISILKESDYYRFNALTGELVDNFLLEESKLNKVVIYPTYNKYKNYYYDEEYNIKNYEEVKPTPKPPTVDEIYEGYQADKLSKIEAKEFKQQMQGVSDDLQIESFYDVETLLIDRLYDYDKLMGTSYSDTYEDLPVKVRLFIERKEEEDYIIFDDVLQMIEEYFDTSSLTAIYKVFKQNKRA